MDRNPDTTSLADHQDNLRRHLDQARESGRPLFVTQGGKREAVVLSPETYDSLVAKAELTDRLELVDRGMAEYREGLAQPLGTAIRQVALDLGLKLDP